LLHFENILGKEVMKKNQTILLHFENKISGNEKKIKHFCFISKTFWVRKKNQTILLHFEKKISGNEKKIKHFCFISKTFWVRKKNVFFKCATQIKYRSNVFATFKKKDGNKVRLHYSKRS